MHLFRGVYPHLSTRKKIKNRVLVRRVQYIPKNMGSFVWKIEAEWGRRGSPRAHTLGKRRHGVHEPF